MNITRKLYKAIVEEGAVSVEDLSVELAAADEMREYWRLSLKRDVSFIWGGVERTLPAGTALGEVDIYPEDGETAEDVAHLFLEQPETWGRSVGVLEREMLDAE